MAATKRTRLKGEERRALILEAARRVFLESGFAGARTRRIAEEAGITEALLYRFFPSKLAIYEAAVIQPLEEFVAAMLAATGEIEASRDDREGGLRRINEMLFHFMRESAPFLAVVLLSELNEGRRFYRNDFHPVLSKPINDVVSRITGWRSPKGDSSLIFAAMVGVHMGLAIDGLLRDTPPDEAQVAGQLTALFSDGMPDEAQQTPVAFPARKPTAARKPRAAAS
ncbi:MAG TPA: TetR/AcrR family transcriptional regulator [Acidimicrobiia bacterium]|nr:TetR/AcrR family transcriptional regulator [Acidimicrobiia bacterium]